MPRAPIQSSRFGRTAGRALARLIGLVMRTSSVVREPPDLDERLTRQAPIIMAFWHGQFMMIPPLKPPGIPTRVIVARHGDAEVIATVLDSYGMELIRGAGAGGRKRDRGGADALRGAVKTLAEGFSIATTADVPPGPARAASAGIITLARLSGRPIVPVAVATTRFRSLATWSRMTINLPYSTIAAVAGEPIHVPREADEGTLEQLRQRLEDRLNAVTSRAYALAKADEDKATPFGAASRKRPVAPGFRLKAYRAVMQLLTPAAPLVLGHRRRQGKEDPERGAERLGTPGRARPAGPLVWAHAASVGETNAVLPVIDALLARRPDLNVLLTTGTRTSAEIAARRLGERAMHQYIPLDAPGFVARFLDHWRPDAAVFVESEIWPNLILDADRRAIPLVLVNARMSDRSFKRWRRNRASAAALLGRFRVVLAQTDALARRDRELGARTAIAAGNLKIDAPPPPVDAVKRAELERAIGGRPVLLAASTHEGEDAIIAAAHGIAAASVPGLLTIIVPRHPERGAAIAGVVAAAGLTARRRAVGELPDAHSAVYIADTIGELGTFYALARVALIGGSLVAHGGQNPIEAVRHGSVVMTGPHTHNFTEAFEVLMRLGGAAVVKDAREIAREATALLSDPEELSRRRERAEAGLAELTGALDATVEAIAGVLPAAPEGLKRAS